VTKRLGLMMLVFGIPVALLSACSSSANGGANGSTSFHRVAQITATAKPGVPYGPLGYVDHQTQTLEYLQYQLSLRFGRLDESFGYTAANGGVMRFNFNGPRSKVHSFVSALRSSGLVASIVVRSRNIPCPTKALEIGRKVRTPGCP
jgi:hypothetical protein